MQRVNTATVQQGKYWHADADLISCSQLRFGVLWQSAVRHWQPDVLRSVTMINCLIKNVQQVDDLYVSEHSGKHSDSITASQNEVIMASSFSKSLSECSRFIIQPRQDGNSLQNSSRQLQHNPSQDCDCHSQTVTRGRLCASFGSDLLANPDTSEAAEKREAKQNVPVGRNYNEHEARTIIHLSLGLFLNTQKGV